MPTGEVPLIGTDSHSHNGLHGELLIVERAEDYKEKSVCLHKVNRFFLYVYVGKTACRSKAFLIFLVNLNLPSLFQQFLEPGSHHLFQLGIRNPDLDDTF